MKEKSKLKKEDNPQAYRKVRANVINICCSPHSGCCRNREKARCWKKHRKNQWRSYEN